MSRLVDALYQFLLVLLLLFLAAVIFIAGAKLGNAVADRDKPPTCDATLAPTTICEPLPGDSGRWRCFDPRGKDTQG